MTFSSKVIKTIVNGTVVYDNGTFNEGYRGCKLEFER
jgi:dihydroorotase-like cyclic amidohydrolase